jgi:hypothetical protein
VNNLKNWVEWGLIICGLLYVLSNFSETFGHLDSDSPIPLSTSSDDVEQGRINPYGTSQPEPEVEAPELSFSGYPCGSDCLKDEAGYRWASQNGINDPDNCTGDTWEFIEGCRVYVTSKLSASL